MSLSCARLRPPAPRWGLATFVGALLVGLLGMHALAMSCSTDQAAVAAPSVTAPSSDHVGDRAERASAAQSTHHKADADGSMSSALMTVCVGLVVSVIVLLVAVCAALRNRGWRVPRPGDCDAGAFPPTGRPPRALTLSQLCLLRC